MEENLSFDDSSPNNRVSLRKVSNFLFLTLGGGLLQMWVLCVVFWVREKELIPGEILGAGGLFFFSTSLVCSSACTLINDDVARPDPKRTSFTLYLAIPIFVVSVVFYTATLTYRFSDRFPFEGDVGLQIAAAVGALLYSYYVATVTGQFGGTNQ